MTAIHVLPEIVLHSINRHEYEHHHVLGMMFQKVKSDSCPLPVNFFHFGEHLSAPPVCGHKSEETDVMINLTEVIDQLTFQRRRIDERTIGRWCIEARNLEAFQSLGRIGKRNVHCAHGKPGGVEDFPDRGRAARTAVGIIHLVAIHAGFDEVKNAVLARIFSGHE